MRAAVEGHELLALELERGAHDLALLDRAGIAVARDVLDLRVLEDRGVELDCLLESIVEPEEGRDLRHGGELLSWCLLPAGRLVRFIPVGLAARRLQFVEQRVEAPVVAFPQLAVLLQPRGRVGQGPALDPARASLPVL